jgi:hypothetical protein
MSYHQSPPIPLDSRDLWSVWRVDDNGNVFVVREHLSQAEAQAVADEFEARGHKQMYWIEPEHDHDHSL